MAQDFNRILLNEQYGCGDFVEIRTRAGKTFCIRCKIALIYFQDLP